MGFIDDISEAIVDASNDVKERARDLKEIARLKREYRDAEKFVKSRYEGIGRDFYEKNKDKKKKDLSDITDALDRMDALQVEIDKLKGGVDCPACGTLNNAEAVYCNKCGERLDGTKEEAETEEDTAEKVDAEVVEEDDKTK